MSLCVLEDEQITQPRNLRMLKPVNLAWPNHTTNLRFGIHQTVLNA